jgi:tRNA-dihydrouridine synthase
MTIVKDISAARPCRIGPFTLPLPAMQAGLAGYSDMAMRVVARRRGCPYAVTEALLDQVLLRGGRGLEKGAILCDADHPVAGQIMGSEPDELAKAAVLLKDAGFDVIDLNFACPVKKVMGRCRGGYLLSDPDHAVVIMRRVRDALGDYPLSVKLRRALNDTPQAADWFDQVFAEACTLRFAAVAVHGRTVEQKYTGLADWSFLKKLTARFAPSPADPPLSASASQSLRSSPPYRPTLFGSGDVFCAQDALRMYQETGVDGVWIARGAIGNPWIFSEFAALLRGEELPPPPTIHAQREALLEHFSLAVEISGEALASRQMRKIAIKYAKLHPSGPDVWREFIAVKNQQEWDDVLARHYTVDGPGVRVGSVPDAEDVCKVSCEPAPA